MSGYHEGFTEGYDKGVEDTLVELRAAVDALRPFADCATECMRNAEAIVFAFDAKHPEAK